MKMKELREMMKTSSVKTILFKIMVKYPGTEARTIHRGTIKVSNGTVFVSVPEVHFEASGYWQQIVPTLRGLKAEQYEAVP